MSFDITGKLFRKYDTVQKTQTFSAREFVIEHSPSQYPQFIKFQLTQDRCSLMDQHNEGDEIKVFFDIRGNKWTDPKSNEDKFFTNLNAWKIEAASQSQSLDGPPDSAYNEAAPPATDALPAMEEDDLPF